MAGAHRQGAAREVNGSRAILLFIALPAPVCVNIRLPCVLEALMCTCCSLPLQDASALERKIMEQNDRGQVDWMPNGAWPTSRQLQPHPPHERCRSLAVVAVSVNYQYYVDLRTGRVPQADASRRQTKWTPKNSKHARCTRCSNLSSASTRDSWSLKGSKQLTTLC